MYRLAAPQELQNFRAYEDQPQTAVALMLHVMLVECRNASFASGNNRNQKSG